MRHAAERLAWCLCAGLGAACSRAPTGPSPSGELARPQAPPAAGRLAEPPTIVLVTLDTLRREHLGCYGYFRDTTPHLDALARESLVFERALATMASTLPSHLSMLTGLYPHQHGMTSNRRGASVPFVSELGRLSAAAVLRQCGYRTAAFVSAAPLSLTTGIQAGFETYSYLESEDGSPQRAQVTTTRVLEWLDSQPESAAPLFLWVHYFDPHEPSDPPAPFDARFKSDEPQRAWIRTRGIDAAALYERYAHSRRAREHFLAEPAELAEGSLGTSSPFRRVASLMNRYDGELAYLDQELGRLFEALKRHGLYEEALLAVVADHGQSLGENTWLGHGTITNQNTFVPWILRLPRALGVAPRRVPGLVSLVDLLPTLLARFELPGNELLLGQFEGEDVLAPGFARPWVLTERTHDEIDDGEAGRQVALLDGRWKLIHRPGGRDELYDLEGAGEFVDVLPAHPEVARRLAAEAAACLARKPALLEEPEGAPEDPELLERLRDLGYAGDDEDGD